MRKQIKEYLDHHRCVVFGAVWSTDVHKLHHALVVKLAPGDDVPACMVSVKKGPGSQ